MDHPERRGWRIENAMRRTVLTRPTRFAEPSMPSPPPPETSHPPGKARAYRDQGDPRSAPCQRHRVCARLGVRRFAVGNSNALRHHHGDFLRRRDERHSHRRTAAFPGRAIRAARHRSVRSSLFGRGRECSHDGAVDPSLYLRALPTARDISKEVLDHIVGHDGVALMTASEIGDSVIATRSPQVAAAI
jgi:hypothetical protein